MVIENETEDDIEFVVSEEEVIDPQEESGKIRSRQFPLFETQIVGSDFCIVRFSPVKGCPLADHAWELGKVPLKAKVRFREGTGSKDERHIDIVSDY